MKFSIIVPVYNVEKYLKRCLDSIKKQSFSNYEVIIVDDGSTDNSKKIIEKYINNKFKYFYKENGGLSSARNYGIKKASGEFIVFIDSDDYINKDTLKKVNEQIKKYDDLDVIRYELCTVDDNYNIIEKYNSYPFDNKSPDEAFTILLKNKFVEPAWLYVVRREYFLDNNFSFPEGRYHEDFGLMPLVIIKARKISAISYCGYNYVKRDNSIMTTITYEKSIKKIGDILHHFDFLIKESSKCTNISKDTLKLFNSYVAIAIISKIKYLKGKDRKKLIKDLEERNAINLLVDDTLKRKIRKKLYSINLNFSRWI